MQLNLTFYLVSFTVIETFQPRHHPEHRPSSGRGPGHPGALLRPREDVPAQHPLPGRGQERRPQSLPQHDSGLLRLQIMPRIITL